MSRFLLRDGVDVTIRDMKKALKSLAVAFAAVACMGLSQPERGCSDAVLREYQEVTQTAELNANEARRGRPIAGFFASVPAVSVIGVSEVALCRNRPRAVLCRGNGDRGGALSIERIREIDLSLRAEFHYVSDEVLHGRPDWWTNDRTCGDCEDYALILSERLSRAGQPGSSMALIAWAPTPYTAHATLLVTAANGAIYEIGVGPSETPVAMDWTRGRRAAFMPMDGARTWYLLARG